MNLVQINERLKDLPMQVIQQYANGMNPEVPPYLALGELQRREIAQKQMANTQGAAQGPQPSVKEQVEQKAGLMELQQMQQQQMAQQMQQPRGPMPVPPGAPQPQAQPEMAMARGGLAGIPVRRDMFEYADGGIVAFQAGGQPKTSYDRMLLENRKEAERKRLEREQFNRELLDDPKQKEMLEAKREFDALSPSEKSSERGQRLKEFFRNVFTSAPAAVVQAPMDALPSKAIAPANPADFMGSPVPTTGLPAALTGASGAAGVKPPPPPRPAAQPPTAMPPAAPAGLPGVAQGQSPLMDEALAMARDKPTAPTAEGIIAEQRKLMPAGMQDEARQKMLADQRGRAEGRRASYDKSKPSGLDDLIRVFGQAGQFKGLSGLAPAYTANQQQRRAEDLAMEKQQDELLTAIDTRSSAFDSEVFGSREKSMTAATKAYQDRLLSNTKALADLAGVDQRRMDEAAGRLTKMEVAKLQAATQSRTADEKVKFEANFMALKAKAMKLAEDGDAPGAARLEAQASAMLLSRGLGGGASGDRGPSPTDRLRAAQSILNDFESTPEEKAMAKREITGIMSSGQAAAPTGGAPSSAIEALRKNPKLAAQFDEKYGKGASAQYLQK